MNPNSFLLPRLISEAFARQHGIPTYPFVPGYLSTCVSYEREQSAILTNDDLKNGWSEFELLYSEAIANLRRASSGSQLLPFESWDGVWDYSAPDNIASSRALLIPEWNLKPEAKFGTVFMVPCHDRFLMMRPAKQDDGFKIFSMAFMAYTLVKNSQIPMSSYLFWYHDGIIDPLTIEYSEDAGGLIGVVPYKVIPAPVTDFFCRMGLARSFIEVGALFDIMSTKKHRILAEGTGAS